MYFWLDHSVCQVLCLVTETRALVGCFRVFQPEEYSAYRESSALFFLWVKGPSKLGVDFDNEVCEKHV